MKRVTLHFFSSYLPTRGTGAEVDTDRAWRIEWSPMFFQMCLATGGTLLFDLDLYRVLTPAARRLFLKLKDRFWRSKRVFLNVDDLTIQGLGFSADRPLKKRKYDLTSCITGILRNPVYIGKIRWGDAEHDGNHPPLITKEQFDRAQNQLAQTVKRRMSLKKPKGRKAFVRTWEDVGELLDAATHEERLKILRHYVEVIELHSTDLQRLVRNLRLAALSGSPHRSGVRLERRRAAARAE